MSDLKEWEESDKQKKKKKERKVKECSDVEYPHMETSDKLPIKGKKNIARNQELRKEKDHIYVGSEENVEYINKGKIKKKKKKNDNEGDSRENFIGESIGKGKALLDHNDSEYNDCHSGSSNKKRDRGEEVFDVESEKRKKKQKKKKKEEKFKECSDVEYPHMETSDKLPIKGKKNIARNQELRKEKDHIYVGSEENVEYINKGKIKKKKKKNDNEGDSRENFIGESIGKGKALLDHNDSEYNDCHSGSSNKKRDRGEEVFDVESEKRKKKQKKKKKEEKFKECSDVEYPHMETSDKLPIEGKKNISRNQELRKEKDHIYVGSEENVEYINKGKSKKKKKKNDNEGDSRENFIGESIGEGKTLLDHKDSEYNDCHSGSSNKKRDRGEEVFDVESEKRKKKTKTVEDFGKKRVDTGDSKTENRGGSTTGHHSKNYELKESSKRVKFSGHVEVFPSSDVRDVGEENQEEHLVQGQRFSWKEDAVIKDAVLNYVQANGLGEKGLDMVMNCSKYSKVKGCWQAIGAALPWRPKNAVYRRARNLFSRRERSRFTKAEEELVLKFHKEHGANWKELGRILGRDSRDVYNAWRLIRLPNRKRGHWSQEEYQTLFDLVSVDLRMKVHEEKKSRHGMLRENIGWSAISEKMGTRPVFVCCAKWYSQLTSSMVKKGEWADTDDYRLLDELLMLDACCAEDVDWDNLIEHRSGDVCRKRWKQMVNHIGEHGLKSFGEQVEVLGKRYCPELHETREIVDSRPLTP